MLKVPMPKPASIEFKGEVLSQSGWAARLGVRSNLISKRMLKGWPIEKVLATDLPRYPRLHGADSPKWKGGRVIMSATRPEKYIGVFSPGHPRANSAGYVREHILIAERALGKSLPDGAVVHHANEKHDDNTNGNLVICQDNAYHKLLHVRMRIRRAGGDPNRQKLCGGCKCCLDRSRFGKSRKSKDGLNIYCTKCVRKKNYAARARRLAQ